MFLKKKRDLGDRVIVGINGAFNMAGPLLDYIYICNEFLNILSLGRVQIGGQKFSPRIGGQKFSPENFSMFNNNFHMFNNKFHVFHNYSVRQDRKCYMHPKLLYPFIEIC